MPPLILTLRLDAETSEFFNSLRQQYFPPERNFLQAHVTLFHHLPGENYSQIDDDLKTICAEYAKFELSFTSLRFLGKGTAAEIKSPELLRLRSNLSKSWETHLTNQDQQKFQPHITIQNKTAPDEARKLYESLSINWQSKTGTADGLQLWHYLGGPWKSAGEYLFK